MKKIWNLKIDSLFLDFSRRLYVFTEHILIFQEALCVHQTDTNFPGRFIFSSSRSQFSRSIFFLLSNRFSRSTSFLVTEQIQILQKAFCKNHRKDFQEGTPLRTDVSEIDLASCFLKIFCHDGNFRVFLFKTFWK